MPNQEQDPEVEALTSSAINALKSAPSSATGTELFNAIEGTDLSHDQKQQVYNNLAKYVTDQACTNLSDPATVMRGNSAGTQFMTKYMETYAADYLAAVEHQALQAVSAVQLPEEGITTTTINEGPNGPEVSGDTDTTLRPENVPQAGFRSSPEEHTIGRRDLSKEATAQWDAIYKQTGQAIVNAMEEQMPKLSPEAQAFLKTCGDTAREKLPGAAGESAATFIMSNTMGLRGALLQTKADGDSLKQDSLPADQRIRGKILGEASNVAQSYINFLPQNGGADGRISEASKPQNKIVNLLRDDGLQKSRQVFDQISRGQLPQTPENRLAPADAANVVNQSIPGREARFAPPQPQAQIGPEAPAVQAPAGQEPAKQQSRLGSVRDTLRGAASSLKNTIGDKLNLKGSEQRLRDVPDNIQNAYKELQKELSDLKKLSAADGTNKIDAALGDADAYGEFKKGSPEIAQREKEIKAEMAQMKEENPGLAQLDRSKVGQVVHSGVRDAAKSAANKLR